MKVAIDSSATVRLYFSMLSVDWTSKAETNMHAKRMVFSKKVSGHIDPKKNKHEIDPQVLNKLPNVLWKHDHAHW